MPVIGVPLTTGATDDLLYARTQFVTRSGRADLVVDYAGADFSDNGADYFINAGQRFLDSRIGHQGCVRRHVEVVAVDAWHFDIEDVVSIQKIVRINSDGSQLIEELSLITLLAELDITASGTPGYWAKNIAAISPELEDTVLSGVSGITGIDDIISSGVFKQQGIILSCPVDEITNFHVYGRFKESRLVDDADTSYWTINYPEILVLAALYELELSYNNMTGAKHWLAAIDTHLFGLEKDLAEFEMGEDIGVIAG